MRALSRIARLEARNLTLSRGPRRLVTGFGLSASAGEAVALTGRNGAGKTSLLRALAGLLRPDAGEIEARGGNGVVLDLDEARSRAFHLLGHLDALKGLNRVREELAFQAGWTGGDRAGLEEAIGRLSLKPLLDLQVRQLSAGQRRRVALARLVIAPRPVWLLDEPLSPLDAERRVLVGTLMSEHLAGGGLLLAAVHDPLPVPARAVALEPAA